MEPTFEDDVRYRAALDKFKSIQMDIEPHAELFWRRKPYKTNGGYWRMSIKMLFPSGFSVRLNYWWRNHSYWSIAQ